MYALSVATAAMHVAGVPLTVTSTLIQSSQMVVLIMVKVVMLD